jgi:riboflavin kinase / FMN adenylyltransferase
VEYYSSKRKIPSVLLTFNPHPLTITNPEIPKKMIMSTHEMELLLDVLGIEIFLVLPFTNEFSKLTPAEFLKDIINFYLKPEIIVVGENHRFGRARSGDAILLKEFGDANGIDVLVVKSVRVNDEKVSSSKIREFIASGDLQSAREMMGRHFQISGIVQKGAGRGRTLGFPTANLALENRVVPPPGVYSTRTYHQDKWYPSISYLGVCPTFGGQFIQLETHLLDISEQLYGRFIVVEFLQKIRGDIKFKTPEELKIRISEDITLSKQTH